MKKELYRAFSDQIYKSVDQIEEATGQRTPADVMIELTRLCSIKCTHCYIGDARWIKDPNEMSTEKVKELLDVLAAKGTLWVCFTGGEAMIRKDFKEIWVYAKKKGFIITLFTNATLINKDMIDFLVEYPPFTIEVSIYGATEQTYEAVSQVKGSYKRCMQGIENIIASQLSWALKTVVIKENAHELQAMRALSEEWGVDFKFDPVINPSVGNEKIGGKAPCATRLTVEDAIEAEFGDKEAKKGLDKYVTASCGVKKDKDRGKREEKLFGCGAGKSSAYFTADAKMQMCLLTPQRGGLINKPGTKMSEEFDKVWDSFGAARNEKVKPDSPCRQCDIAFLCSNCAGFAHLENGDEHSAVEYLCKATHLKAEKFKLKHKCSDKHFLNKLKENKDEAPRPEKTI